MGASAAAPARVVPVLRETGESFLPSAPSWYLFFFVSGFPALLYQIVWQRSLFTFYGVNIESVTMVVTAFMLGLGIGSLAGGMISQKRNWPLLAIFGVTELLIAVYGIFSLNIFHWAANYTAGSGPLGTGLVAFSLVAFPTVLMGSTLPILVAYTVRLSRNVGTSVGSLYAVNTMGSAVACFCAGLFLMRYLGEGKTVALAAGLNAVVGGCVLFLHFKHQGRERELDLEPASTFRRSENSRMLSSASYIQFPLAVAASAIAGFISLGYEMIWYRLFSFTTGGLAKSFAFLLGAFLAGIAGGSVVSKRICERMSEPQRFTQILVAAIFSANLIGFLVGPILSNLVVHFSYEYSLLPIGVAAGCLGAIFPLLCHISIPPDESAGARTSYLYLGNILGSVLGSYVTGFVLMNIWPLRSVSIALATLGFALALFLALNAQLNRTLLLPCCAGILLTAWLVAYASPPLFEGMYEKLQMKSGYAPGFHFRSTVENRSGVISVLNNGMVFGGGMYDGRFSVSLVSDSNGIQRVFALSFYDAHPKNVLMIGLSSGSWAQVVANHPQVEHLTIVEINPGYLQLIAGTPVVASLLRNPKVHIEVDDGRRWLVRNPGLQFDSIIMNTTYNWRSNASNLLSTEFLQLVHKHLKPGGTHLYNTTDSNDALATGLRVFPYGMRIGNFLAVSDAPLQLDAARWRDVLLHYSIDGKPVFDLAQERDRRRFEEVTAMTRTMDEAGSSEFSLESADHIRQRTAGARIITDDNMGSEWQR
ncbi:MAG TPA: fused MFS/spermidine synthase [Candidatus Binatia bacterium]|nr:fused MFS/spermidine synthase [Candidatus Binatia bacterium]